MTKHAGWNEDNESTMHIPQFLRAMVRLSVRNKAKRERTVPKPCDSCNGTGDRKPGSGKKDCGSCGGTGTETYWDGKPKPRK